MNQTVTSTVSVKQSPPTTGVSVEHFEARLEQLTKHLENKAADISSRQMHKILQDKAESDTLLEGRAALFTVEVEKKVMSKIQAF